MNSTQAGQSAHSPNSRFSTAAAVALTIVMSAAFAPSSYAQSELGSSFTYQGQLMLDVEMVNDTADFVFRLWDAETDGNMIGSAVSVDNVTIVDGLFSVELDFGADAFNGQARWLEIDAASPSGGAFSTLSPRQPMTATPYSFQTRGLLVESDGNVGIGTEDALGRLHVSRDSDPSVIIENTGDSTGKRRVSLNFRHSGSNGSRIKATREEGNEDTMRLSFGTQTAGGSVFDRMTIDSIGNVGIGTDSPSTKLDVAGTINANAFVGDGSGLTNVPGIWSEIGNDIHFDGDADLVDVGSFQLAFI
jgi:hypothetical protein